MPLQHDEPLRILLLGNGGREHALCWKLSQSSRLEALFVCPGNGGTASGLPRVQNVVHIRPDDLGKLVTFARAKRINFVVIGPEAPLIAGVADHFRSAGLTCFGPSLRASRMEGSKTFAKDFMARHNIPTAKYHNFSDFQAASVYLDSIDHSIVLKADGLAAGKGVLVPSTKAEAHAALKTIMVDKEFGTAGDELVIEEFLEGEELSFLTVSDGYTIRSLPAAQDHKQIFEGDCGPNTGGMGCYAPTRVATPELVEEVHRTILQPTIDGMRKEAMPFVGLLFTGIMVTKNGPKTLEYNVRFGDPETQTLLPLLSADTDLAEIMVACTDHYLDAVSIKIEPKYSATVVAAAGGYPGPYVKGDSITLDPLPLDTFIFHAGTTFSGGTLKTSGGRVIASTSTASTLKDAVSQAYKGISSIKFSNMYYRPDIGHRALKPADSPQRAQEAIPLTYASAGVDIASGNDLVKRITPHVRSTARSGAPAKIGGFGGLFDLAEAGYTSPPTLIGAIDGVGTKLKIALAMNKHDTVGIDLVAMNVNDLVVQGAEPLFFLDCYSCSHLDVGVAEAFVKGVAAGCKEAGCALVGGETAEMPGLFSADEYDAVGATVGAITQGQKVLPDKTSMRAGDAVIGIASSGVHSNGFSLVRKILDNAGLSVHDPAPWPSEEGVSVGAGLLTPTRIYVKALLKPIHRDLIKGLAHITGGGLLENIPRMLPDTLAAEMDCETWEVPEVLKWLKAAGGLEANEFARVFNCGLGMVGIVAQESVEEALKLLNDAGEDARVVGRLVDRADSGVVLKGMSAWR